MSSDLLGAHIGLVALLAAFVASNLALVAQPMLQRLLEALLLFCVELDMLVVAVGTRAPVILVELTHIVNLIIRGDE